MRRMPSLKSLPEMSSARSAALEPRQRARRASPSPGTGLSRGSKCVSCGKPRAQSKARQSSSAARDELPSLSLSPRRARVSRVTTKRVSRARCARVCVCVCAVERAGAQVDAGEDGRYDFDTRGRDGLRVEQRREQADVASPDRDAAQREPGRLRKLSCSRSSVRTSLPLYLEQSQTGVEKDLERSLIELSVLYWSSAFFFSLSGAVWGRGRRRRGGTCGRRGARGPAAASTRGRARGSCAAAP